MKQSKEKPMSKIDDLLAAEAKAVGEAELTTDPDAPLPAHVKVTRGHPRAKNLQVRFRDDEFDELSAYAEQRGLPVSTVVRSLVLQAIAPVDDLKSALDKLETDLAALRRKALSGLGLPITGLFGRVDSPGGGSAPGRVRPWSDRVSRSGGWGEAGARRARCR
jgi:hypothetical protein